MSDKKPKVGVQDQKVIDNNEPEIISRLEKEERQSVQEYGNLKVGDKLLIGVKVYSPFRDYFDGPAFSVSAENATGPFDILPRHRSFISLLLPCEVVIRTPKDDKYGPVRIQINGGIAHVKANQVIIFLDV